MTKVPRMFGARRSLFIALGFLLAVGFHREAPSFVAHPGVDAAHAKAAAPVFVATAAPNLSAPRVLAWSFVAATPLVDRVTVRSLYLRHCALRL